MLEVFLTVATAYLLKSLKVFSEEHARVLINYVLYFSLPTLAFKVAYNLGFSKEVLLVGFSAWLVITFTLCVSFVVGKALRLSSSDLRSFIVSSAFGNTAFLGYPYSFSFYGEGGLHYAVIYDSVGSFLAVSSIGFFVLSGRLNLKQVLTFPPFLGLLSGFLLRPLQLPAEFLKFVEFVSASLLPVVLFSLGLSFNLSVVGRSVRFIALVLFIKMLLSPFVALMLLKALPLEPLAYKVAVLESAMPTMITASLLVAKFGLNVSLAIASASLGILSSFLILPLWVFVILQKFCNNPLVCGT